MCKISYIVESKSISTVNDNIAYDYFDLKCYERMLDYEYYIACIICDQQEREYRKTPYNYHQPKKYCKRCKEYTPHRIEQTL